MLTDGLDHKMISTALKRFVSNPLLQASCYNDITGPDSCNLYVQDVKR